MEVKGEGEGVRQGISWLGKGCKGREGWQRIKRGNEGLEQGLFVGDGWGKARKEGDG